MRLFIQLFVTFQRPCPPLLRALFQASVRSLADVQCLAKGAVLGEVLVCIPAACEDKVTNVGDVQRVGGDGFGSGSRRRGRKQRRQHGAVALASSSPSIAAPAGQPEEDTTAAPVGDLCCSCRRQVLLRKRADICALQMECDELAAMAAGGCSVKKLKGNQLRLAQQLHAFDELLAELEAESCLRCGPCSDAALA